MIHWSGHFPPPQIFQSANLNYYCALNGNGCKMVVAAVVWRHENPMDEREIIGKILF
jgi:hypothetical protein